VPVLVNDVHSRLNRTTVADITRPRDIDELRAALRTAADRNLAVAIAGGRHAMGGQQFAADSLLIDITAMDRMLRFDAEQGLIEMEAGATWPTVIRATHDAQPGPIKRWAIRQKQTGADNLTLAGSVSANAHGRGLFMKPLVDDVESLTLITPDAQTLACSRTQNAELFSLVVGGYGLFGVIAAVTLHLGPRRRLRRLVDILDIDDAIPAVRRRASEGCLYGDFQYAIDAADDSFLRRGVCACYAPIADDTPVSDGSADLSEDDWLKLLQLAHTDKRRAFHEYATHYLATHGRVYFSDHMQLSTYIPSYDQFLKHSHDQASCGHSLLIGENCVPPHALVEFLNRCRDILRRTNAEDIYGTIRSIQRDDVTFLPWARADYACVIFNLRTAHDAAGIARTADAFRQLNAAALALGGSFYLTYHRFAPREQLESAYPMFESFLAKKLHYDPEERFQSEWYRHHRALFA
jgi:FAD/FMN-containing dehydrogenase